MSAWPEYAKVLLDGYTEERESALSRTEMESGPPKQARVRSRVLITRQVTVGFATVEEYLDFLDWYRDELGEGAAWFEFFDTVRNATVPARFAEGGLSAQAEQQLETWKIPVKLETWGDGNRPPPAEESPSTEGENP
jgi:hypothetical protein